MSLQSNKNLNDGYIALLSVIIVSAIGVVAALSVLSFGANYSNANFYRQEGVKAMALANACVEEALQEINDNNNFTGSNTVQIGEEECEYSVSSIGGAYDSQVEAVGSVNGTVRRVEVLVETHPSAQQHRLRDILWQEVADFD